MKDSKNFDAFLSDVEKEIDNINNYLPIRSIQSYTRGVKTIFNWYNALTDKKYGRSFHYLDEESIKEFKDKIFAINKKFIKENEIFLIEKGLIKKRVT